MIHAPRRMLLGLLVLLAPSGTSGPLTAQTAVPLQLGQTATGQVARGDTVRFTLDTRPDFFVRGSLEQLSADVAIRVLRPDSTQFLQVNVRKRGEEPFQFETDREGAYWLEVVPVDEAQGDFRIRLDRLEPVATQPEALAEQLLSAYDGPDSPGAAVRVWRDGETLFSRSWGMGNLAYEIPIRADVPTNIGSTSKQFTAFAIMLLVEKGRVSLDDDVRTHISELPDFGEVVQVRHLLSHATGYREIYNLLAMSPRRIDLGDHISRDEIIRVVQNQPALQNSPGAEWNYNNTAYALAALLVERVSGLDFPTFMQENVFQPLGMTRSAVRPHNMAIVPGRTVGYAPHEDGGYQEMRDLSASMGAGGIYASLEDLQLWGENMMEPRVGSPETVQEMMTPFVTTTGDTTSYGLGLMIDQQRGLQRVHHGGADVAHRSMLAYYPEIGAGITVQSNHASFNSNVAFRLAGAFFADAMDPPEGEDDPAADPSAETPFDPDSYDAEEFDALSGRYALDANPAFTIRLFRDDQRLMTQATGQPAVEVFPTSDSTFALRVVEASFTVHRNAEGRPEALTLHQGGMNQRATRLDDEGDGEGNTAAPWEPTPDDLQAFTGRYFGEELETFYTVVLEDDKLVIRHRLREDVALTSGERDHFSAGINQLAFERDRNGRVIGFYVGNGRTRDVRFERVR